MLNKKIVKTLMIDNVFSIQTLTTYGYKSQQWRLKMQYPETGKKTVNCFRHNLCDET